MSLPIDRTNKSTLDSNLVNGNTSDAPAIKNSNDVVYNTIDELYNYSQGLVNAGILTQASQTPIANKIAQRDANGNVVSTFPVSTGQNPNLIFNPSARLGFSGWTNVGGGTWTAAFGGGGDGGYFQVTSSVATAGASTYDSAKIPVNAGQIINLSAEINSIGQSAGSAPQIEVHAFNSSDVDLGVVCSINLAIGLGWANKSASAPSPANTTYLRVRMIYWVSSISTFTAYRKIKLEAGNYATTFSDDNTLNTQQYGSVLPLAQILSGGNKIQSGTSSGVVTVAGTAVNVPITFPTVFLSIPVVFAAPINNSINSATYMNALAYTASTTGLTVSVNTGTAQTITFAWVAIAT